MARSRTDMHRLQELVRLHRLGRTTRAIARMLGMGRNTITTYVGALTRAGLLQITLAIAPRNRSARSPRKMKSGSRARPSAGRGRRERRVARIPRRPRRRKGRERPRARPHRTRSPSSRADPRQRWARDSSRLGSDRVHPDETELTVDRMLWDVKDRGGTAGPCPARSSGRLTAAVQSGMPPSRNGNALGSKRRPCRGGRCRSPCCE